MNTLMSKNIALSLLGVYLFFGIIFSGEALRKRDNFDIICRNIYQQNPDRYYCVASNSFDPFLAFFVWPAYLSYHYEKERKK